MGLISEEIQIKLNPKDISRLERLGYDLPMRKATKSSKKKYGKEFVYDIGSTITIKVCDLSPCSHVKVQCKCDYCGNSFDIAYVSYLNYMSGIVPKLACHKCVGEKYKEVCLLKLGVENPSQLLEIKEKKRQTNLMKRGVEFPIQSKEVMETMMNNNIKKYGVPHIMQVPEIAKKNRDSVYRHYGENDPLHSKETREKIVKSLHKNNTVSTSRQQRYINNLYNTELNYPLKYWNVDMYDKQSMMYIEYDGTGHDLNVKLGQITSKEFYQRETTRFYSLKQAGYKMMRIISPHDKLPSDDILLQMLSDAKQYFKDYPEHSWINFDIDNNTVKNAEYERSYFYGNLRKITKNDLVSA